MAGLQDLIAAQAGNVVAPVVAPVTADAPVVTPVAVAPVAVAPVAVAPVAVAPVAAPAPLAGGTMLATMMGALATASVGNQRNDLVLGTGIYLLKLGKFILTSDGKWKISSFAFICLKAIRDGQGIAPGTARYAGPIVGETYEEAMFQDYSPKKLKGTMGANLSAIQTCMGWTPEKFKQFQSTPEGQQIIAQLWAGLFGIDMAGTATGQPCIFSNQVVLQLSTKSRMYEKKDKATGQPVYDGNGQKLTGTNISTYWDKKIRLQELETVMPEVPAEQIIAAFGTAEAFMAALEQEKKLEAQFGV